MKTAIALMPHAVMKRANVRAWMTRKCEEAGLWVEWVNVVEQIKDYSTLLRKHRNVMTWNCRVTAAELASEGQNVLHFDNSLLSQGAGLFVDRGGFFGSSNLSRMNTWKQGYAHANPEFYCGREFGCEAFAGGDPAGPVMVALQMRDDCALGEANFPLAANQADKVKATLGLLAELLPKDVPVVVRPHPRERGKYSDEDFKAAGWRDNWTLQWEGKFSECVRKCCAMVCVNSTCASEGVLLGVPTATLGLGGFSGAGVTLECAHNGETLRGLLEWRSDQARARAYVSAILGRHFIPYDIAPKSGRPCEELEQWLRALQ
jgi:hypothetical protein